MATIREHLVVWAPWFLLPALLLGCAPSGGGGGGGSGPQDEESGSDGAVAYGCGGEVPLTGGVNELPQYYLIPAPAVPRFIREGERPAQVDLSEYVPTPCNQGTLNSCAAWAGAYGLMTYLAAENIEGWLDLDRTDRQFSPTFVFNQVNAACLGRSCYDTCTQAGAFLADVFVFLRDTGCATWADVPYTVDDCETLPDAAAAKEAGAFRITYFRPVQCDVANIRSYLEQRIPVVAVLEVGTACGQLAEGEVYCATQDEDTFKHAVLVVGYDDDLEAIKVMNSWGNQWGDGGFGFISYDAWPQINTEAYVVGRELTTPVTSVADAAAQKTRPRAQQADAAEVVNPLLDTDGDGYPNTMELEFAAFELDPEVPDDNPDYVPLIDTDADGWPDVTEVALGSDPHADDDFPFGPRHEYPEEFFQQPDFVACVDYLLFDVQRFASGGTGPRGVTVADLNRDDPPDVVVANTDFDNTGSGANVTVLLGRGDGTLDAPAVVATGQAPRYLAAGLLNGDAFVDLAFTDDDRETVNVLLGNGDGTFEAGAILTVAGGAGPIALADLDADGSVDLIVPGTGDTNLFFGAGDGTFPTQQTVDAGFSRTPVVPVDMNDDSVVDLGAYRLVDGRFGVLVMLGAGDGTFTEAEYIDLGPLEIGISVPIALAPGDFDGDGHTDLAVALVADSTVSILFGAGDGTLPRQQDVSTTAFVGQPDGLATADVDGDGLDDLALASQTGDAVVLRSNADGTFTESSHTVADGEIATIVSLAVGDLDGDDDADIVVPAGVPPEVVVLRSVCELAGGT